MLPKSFKVGTTFAVVGFLLVAIAALIQALGASQLMQGVNVNYYADFFGYPGLFLWLLAVVSFAYGAIGVVWSSD